MRDWCASGGRDTNRERNHGRDSRRRDLAALSEAMQRTRSKSVETRCSRFDVDQAADESRNPTALLSVRKTSAGTIAAKRCIESPARAMMAEWSFREAEGSPRGWAKDSRAHQQRCCLSIMQSTAINNDGVLTITF